MNKLIKRIPLTKSLLMIGGLSLSHIVFGEVPSVTFPAAQSFQFEADSNVSINPPLVVETPDKPNGFDTLPFIARRHNVNGAYLAFALDKGNPPRNSGFEVEKTITLNQGACTINFRYNPDTHSITATANPVSGIGCGFREGLLPWRHGVYSPIVVEYYEQDLMHAPKSKLYDNKRIVNKPSTIELGDVSSMTFPDTKPFCLCHNIHLIFSTPIYKEAVSGAFNPMSRTGKEMACEYFSFLTPNGGYPAEDTVLTLYDAFKKTSCQLKFTHSGNQETITVVNKQNVRACNLDEYSQTIYFGA